MPVTHKSAISFGLVYIPVDLYAAVKDGDIHFNQLTKDGHERVRYVKTCAGCKKELKAEDIVKGFQYDNDKYVIVDDKDFEKIKTEKDRSIQILQFSTLDEIPSVYFEKSYMVLSQTGGGKAFELLRRAMQETKKVAIGKTVMGTKETMVVLMPTENGILLETLYYYDEIQEMPQKTASPKLAEAELAMARQLIGSMEKPFEPKLYKDEYQEKLRGLIAKKIDGKEIVAEAGAKPDNIINLMDALKQSLAQQETEKLTNIKPNAKRSKTG